MSLTGQHHIGGERTREGAVGYRAVDFETGADLEPEYCDATSEEIGRAATAAAAAAPALLAAGRDARAAMLLAIAEAIEATGDVLIDRAHRETALPRARLVAERGRTTGQLRMFAGVIRDGAYLDLRIDRAQPDRAPRPRADLRRLNVPLGPVAVFGASNFPLAYSVAGGDTASALAAGCPVVVKGHPAHPGTTEIVAAAVASAIAAAGLPAGTFSVVHGGANRVGKELVTHRAITAVGFTGSLRGGRALFDLASARAVPIPVFAEMGSINPVFVLPQAARTRAREIATGFTASVTQGVGQFCTNPGVLVLQSGEAANALMGSIGDALGKAAGGPMLHAGIASAFRVGLATRASNPAVEPLGPWPEPPPGQGVPAALKTTAAAFLSDESLRDELFGPATLIVLCDSAAQMLEVAAALPGQLTASIHGEPEELAAHANLVQALQHHVGRLVFGGYPTGVEVCPAMVHGGPYPATTAPQSTAVGSAAIRRFLRPVCFQDAPAAALPAELRDENPDGLLRLVDGVWSREAL